MLLLLRFLLNVPVTDLASEKEIFERFSECYFSTLIITGL